MVKLSVELIQQCMQYTNPCRERELEIRGYKVAAIENLGATGDQFDCIDLSDNDIRKLDGFPLLNRISTLLLNNNRIVRIGENLERCIPNLESLILTGNQLQELGDLEPLTTLPKLRCLSLLQNPVAYKQHYRLYVAFKFPELRLLDFRKIKRTEREEANQLFKSKKGKELQKEIAKKSKTFVPGANVPEQSKNIAANPQEIYRIREAIHNATSYTEVEKLVRMLEAGQIPGQKAPMNAPPEHREIDQDYEEATNGH